MSKCEDCGKNTKELFEVTTSKGTKLFCKECAKKYDSRATRKSNKSSTIKTHPARSGRYGGTIR